MDVIEGSWRKSSYSFSCGNCAEVGTYRKSSRSAGSGECVEAGSCSHGVAVRDTKLAESPVLTFAAREWERFTSAVKSGTVPS